MFIGAGDLGGIGWFILSGVAVLASAFVAHLVWVARVARSSALHERSGLVQALLLLAALMTPVISFYTVALISSLRRKVRGEVAWWLAAMIGSALTFAVIGAARTELQYAPEFRSWTHAAQSFAGQTAYLVAMEALVFMVARVFGRSARPATWIACLTTAAFVVVMLLLYFGRILGRVQ